MLALLNIGFPEMLLLAAAAVMLFGGDLPDVARKAARFVGKLRSLSQDLTRELNMPNDLTRPPPELRRPPELDLGPEEREVLQGPLKLSPRPPFENTPDNPLDAELGPPRDGAAEQADAGDAATDAGAPRDPLAVTDGEPAGRIPAEESSDPATAPSEGPPVQAQDPAPTDDGPAATPDGSGDQRPASSEGGEHPARDTTDDDAPGADARSDDLRPRHPDDPA